MTPEKEPEPEVSESAKAAALELEAKLESLEGMQWGDPVYGCKREARRELIAMAFIAEKQRLERAESALAESLSMALDELWFTYRPKGYGDLHCCMCKVNLSNAEDHGPGCYFHELEALAAPAQTAKE